MAQININTIRRIYKERNTIHERVQTTYTAFEHDENKYIQFDMYGKAGRDFPEKNQPIYSNRPRRRTVYSKYINSRIPS